MVSLSEVTRWLAKRAEALGVDIYPGFAASKVVQRCTNQLCRHVLPELSDDNCPGIAAGKS